jgi:hypothetical protein
VIVPYVVRRHPSGHGYQLVEGSSGRRPGHRFSKHAQSKKTAEAQRRAIEANSHHDYAKGGPTVNPWAACHASVGPAKSKKFERCVRAVKKKSPIRTS